MDFFSDNTAPVHPAIWQALAAADAVDHAYDGDALSQSLDARFSALFEHEVTVVWSSTGTSANALALSLLCPPYGGILCHEEAHIVLDECGAIEHATGGARLLTCPGNGAKLDVDILRARIAKLGKGVHHTRPFAVSLTNVTEYGRVYRADEVAAIGAFCRDQGLKLHMDGARFANALVRLNARPADLTWRAGVDALSFGFTKNGAMNAEALILFDPAKADEARRRRKRAGHLLSKGRYMAAQLHAMLEGDLWLANARAANAAGAVLAQAAGDRLIHPVDANMLFVRFSDEEAARLRAQGFGFHPAGPGAARLVASWHQSEADVAPFAAAIAAL
ncbi:threonine aldolase family protein [Sphingobium nicotianae]|uniref:Low specificity L-threonine aldolase n=1 Tax=Sphingobium nicotianae TaxID=2782607 RepID=A0A9X1DEQ1_9SPHN|nr:beta-eliminating lyase-related protein [Sphingobium nicotianae]MBT2188570.1 low specificity L-threonine aldolase [Sphingobium nicotianae]